MSARGVPAAPARWIRALLRRAGLHPRGPGPAVRLPPGRRALVVATNHGTLADGRPTGVFASELTAAYYAFADAGLAVDVASPAGGRIPIDPLSMWAVVRGDTDDRLLADDTLLAARGPREPWASWTCPATTPSTSPGVGARLSTSASPPPSRTR